MAGVALSDIDLQFVWQAWDLWHWAGSGGALGSRCRHDRRGRLCGRRGTWRHPVSCGVAGVALGYIDLHFMCQAYLVTSIHFVWQAWHLATSTVTLCHNLALVARLNPVVAVVAAAVCVAGVALGDI